VQGICPLRGLGSDSNLITLIVEDKSVEDRSSRGGPRRPPQPADRGAQRSDRERHLPVELFLISCASADQLQSHQSCATRLERSFDVLRNAWIFLIGHGF
jgi:hypothetical protein